ncbi:MAG: ImmA/IrrE family metallo-endopeptidase [Rhodobacteraceae bacterium]|nr:ImmA/IrrE family metallo-endopeptidase [Paracoccaceae bacterium]
MRVPVKPELIHWACERSRIDREILAQRFNKLPEWERGETRPTLDQLERFARSVHVPVGTLFLSQPPDEPVPIPDFRTFAGQAVARPSPNLLDMIYACQERQSWYRDFAVATGQSTLDFIGSATVNTPPEAAAAKMREVLGFDLAVRGDCTTWIDALRLFIRQAEAAGVLVMVSEIVVSNTSRPLDVDEFRGFALSDPFAPLVFINGADTKAAQMFTLAHELAHLWLDATALSDPDAAPGSGHRREEAWCNAVAAELLVPLATLRADLQQDEPIPDTLQRLVRRFKVSTLVILRRLFDADRIDREQFDAAWAAEIACLPHPAQQGGNFYRITLSRVGRRFARALVISTLEGHTLYRDAFRMLGVSNTETFYNIGREAGVIQ